MRFKATGGLTTTWICSKPGKSRLICRNLKANIFFTKDGEEKRIGLPGSLIYFSEQSEQNKIARKEKRTEKHRIAVKERLLTVDPGRVESWNETERVIPDAGVEFSAVNA